MFPPETRDVASSAVRGWRQRCYSEKSMNDTGSRLMLRSRFISELNPEGLSLAWEGWRRLAEGTLQVDLPL